MKNVNIKKVVAGAAALAIAAGSLGAVVSAANVADSSYTTPNGLARADMFNAQGAPSYNIVVGSTGHASDVVWAANIAAAIGKKAYNVSTASATGGDVVVEVGAEGITTVSGDGYLNDRINLGLSKADAADKVTFSLLNNDYSVLYDDYVDGKLKNDNSYEIKISESITANTSAFFSKNKDVKDLLMTVDRQGIVYTLSFDGDGLPYAGSASDVYFDTSSKLDLYFMGKKYNVQKIETDGRKITLAESGSSVVKNTGDSFSVTGEDDQAYTIEIGNAYTGPKMMLILKKDGTTLKSSTFEENDDVVFDGYPLKESISVKEILDDTSNANNDLVELSIGEGALLVLEDGKALPGYKSGTNDLWRVKVNKGTTIGAIKYIKNIEVTNEAARWDREDLGSSDSGLVVGDSIELPLSLGSLEFMGLTEETTYNFEIGDNEINWFDRTGREHSAFMYKDNYDNTSLSIDGQDYYFDVNTDGFLAIRKGNSSTSGFATLNVNGGSQVFNDTTGRLAAASAIIGFIGSDNSTETFYHVEWSNSDVILRLSSLKDDGTSVKYNHGRGLATWSFLGTFLDSDVSAANEDYFDYLSNSEAGKKYAIFQIEDGETDIDDADMNLVVDAYTKGMVYKSDFDNNYTGKVIYDAGSSLGWTLDDDKSEELRFGYTAFGAKVEIDGTRATVMMPERDLKVRAFLGGGSTTSTTRLESEVTLTTPGEVVDADGIKVKLVSAPQGSATTYTPAAFGNIAYLDTDTLPAGNKIIVGGWMVNEQAKTLGLEDLVTKAGDFVAGKNAQGNIVVAGFHKEDTANAAKELIAAIEAMN